MTWACALGNLEAAVGGRRSETGRWPCPAKLTPPLTCNSAPPQPPWHIPCLQGYSLLVSLIRFFWPSLSENRKILVLTCQFIS
jgi:hypothetical protein